MKENKKLLIVAAHPDDEVLGCGATVAKLAKSGWEAHSLILGEGVTSRGEVRDAKEYEKELSALKGCVALANRELGVKKVYTFALPDNRFDSVDLLDVVKIVERIKRSVRPSLILTHYPGDLNIDHKVTYNAVLTATRPVVGETVRRVLAFEVLSSTEWSYPLSFSPDVFYGVKDTLRFKVAAMKRYKGELRQYPHPRSIKAMINLAEYHGIRSGLDYAEAFKLVRENNV